MNTQYKKLNIFRVRDVFSIGIIITDQIIWTGKWFRYVTIQEEKVKCRTTEFNEWSYTFHWSKWSESWEFKKLIK